MTFVMMNERNGHVTPEDYTEWNYIREWDFENISDICRRMDLFQVKAIARSIQGESSGELSNAIYSYISDSCLDMLVQVIKNGLLFMRVSNRKEFKIQDFKNGVVGAYKLDNLPSRLIVGDSCKYAVHNFP